MSTQTEPTRDRWNTIVVPAAKGLERFFWNLAWFGVLLMVLFGGPCVSRMQQPVQKGDTHEQQAADPPK
jgi:hypothetical protein